MKKIHSIIDDSISILLPDKSQIVKINKINPLSNNNNATVVKSDSLNTTVSNNNNKLFIDSVIEITSNSILYQPFQVLKNYFEVPFDKVYNEDMQTYSNSYLFDSYINKLDALSNAKTIMQNVKNFIYENAFNMQQIEILISNIFNIAAKYGEHEVGFINGRIEHYQKSNSNNNDFIIYINELKKSIPIIYNTRELLLYDLKIYLSDKKSNLNQIYYFNNDINLSDKNLSKKETEIIIVPKNDKKLSVKQIALIHFYNGTQITRDNADKIAADYDYNSKTSGEGLFQDYIYYSSRANRIAKPHPFTPKKLKNKIELFESVIKYLDSSEVSSVMEEIKTLKAKFSDEFE